MRGIERTFGVSRRTVSAWLKGQANDPLPLEETLQPVDSKKIPVLEGDELRSFVFRSSNYSAIPCEASEGSSGMSGRETEKDWRIVCAALRGRSGSRRRLLALHGPYMLMPLS